MPSPSNNSTAQLMFDWDIGHQLPWLHLHEVARMIQCSEDHAFNLLLDGSLDVGVDIRGPESGRRYVRVLRDSVFRFITDRHGPPTDFAARLNFYLGTTRPVYASYQIAAHLRCSEDHILNLKGELSLDISSAGSQRSYPRTSRTQLIEFLKKRRIV